MHMANTVVILCVVSIGILTTVKSPLPVARNLVSSKQNSGQDIELLSVYSSSPTVTQPQQREHIRGLIPLSKSRKLLFFDLWGWFIAVFRAIFGFSDTESPNNGNNGDRSFAIDENVVKFSCSDSEAELANKGAAAVTIATSTVYIGTRQVTSINQNPIVTAYDQNSNQLWCREDYETTGADGRGLGLLSEYGKLYAAFTTDGTQGSASEDFRRFTSGGWLTSYGSGGGPKVSILLEIDPSTGEGTVGTFLRAQLSDGKTNTLVIRDMFLSKDSTQILVQAQSFFLPLQANGERMTEDECGATSPFDYTVILSSDLLTATDAVCFLKGL